MSEYTDQYRDRLIFQYWDKPNARAEIELLAGEFERAYEFFRDLPDAYDVDLAVGEQQDVIGRVVGQPRLANLSDDDQYRVVLRLKIAANNAIVTAPGMADALEFLTQTSPVEVEDGLDMTFLAAFREPIDQLVTDIIKAVSFFPSPQGVRFIGFVVPEVLPKFGVTGIVGEEPEDTVEGFGELGFQVFAGDDVIETSDGAIVGGNDLQEPVLPTEGGRLAELYEV